MEIHNIIALFVWALESIKIQLSYVYVKMDIMMITFILFAKVIILKKLLKITLVCDS